MHTHIYTYIHTCVYIYIYTYICIYIYTYVHMYIMQMYVYIYIYIHVYVYMSMHTYDMTIDMSPVGRKKQHNSPAPALSWALEKGIVQGKSEVESNGFDNGFSMAYTLQIHCFPYNPKLSFTRFLVFKSDFNENWVNDNHPAILV